MIRPICAFHTETAIPANQVTGGKLREFGSKRRLTNVVARQVGETQDRPRRAGDVLRRRRGCYHFSFHGC